MNKNVVIVAAKRTPMGAFQGQFSPLSASDLGACAVESLFDQPAVNAEQVEALYFGSVLTAGQGQAPARQAALKGGLPLSVPCTTINKVCGSGMQSVIFGYNQIRLGDAKTVIGGGMESMTNAPYMLPKARGGYRMGHGDLLDHLFFDGLQDVKYGKLMGNFAELCAEKYHFSREMQDDYAIGSLSRALEAQKTGAFDDEITPVTVKSRNREQTFSTDEQPGLADIDKIRSLRPAFKKEGTVTAANASSISDGAAALLLMDEDEANRLGAKPLVRIVGCSTHAQDPDWFTTAPIGSIDKLLKKINWSQGDVDLFEINEAFAVVTMAAISEMGLEPEKVNVNGGACALGHPIGASGARILVTLIHALRKRNLKRGIASLCIGGGEATAIAIETI